MDVGEKTPHLHRLELTKERFASYEEADAYAEVLGGYCDSLRRVGRKTAWILLVRQELIPSDEKNEQKVG